VELVVSAYVASKILDKVGRKKILLVGEVVTIIFLELIAMFYYYQITSPIKYFIITCKIFLQIWNEYKKILKK